MKRDNKKPIGGFIELEVKNIFKEYHSTLLKLNLGRNALKYSIQSRQIKRLIVPRYTCPILWDVIRSEGCSIIFYDINEDFLPVQDFDPDDFILYVNYFGVCSEQVKKMVKCYKNLIIDNAQAFFYPTVVGHDSFYSPRKFFGVPDGAYLKSESILDKELILDESWSKCEHLLKKVDFQGSNAHEEFIKAEILLENEPIKKMSLLTETILKSVDYDEVRRKRLENFNFLAEKLGSINELKLNLTKDDVPLCYPLLIEKEGLREHLISNNIYISKYWSGIKRM